MVYLTQLAAYISPSNFTDPELFIPERWAKDPPARYVDDNKKVLQPFSVGRRNCIERK
jgi:cytochrome P450